MKNYWSLSKFADFLRNLFGISKMSYARTRQGWSDYEMESRRQSRFGYNLIESLDMIQNVVMYIPTKIEDTIRYFKNWNRGTHILKTNTKRGQWGDLCTKIPDALMKSIIDFVEVECYNMQKYCGVYFAPNTKHYIIGLDWLYFQFHISTGEGSSVDHPYTKIIEAYWFAKNEYSNFDAYEGINLDSFKFNSEVRTNYDLINEREKKFSDKVTLHCKNIVEYRDYLWT